MSFLLRAALVIGALSYFAATRDQPAPALGAGPPASLAMAWEALPTGARDRVAQGLAQGLAQDVAQAGMAEIGRRMGAGAAPSRDTLAAADLRPAWRGVDGR